MRSSARLLMGLWGVAVCAFAVTLAFANLGATAATPNQSPAMSQGELQALDRQARGDLVAVAAATRFHKRLPVAPPSGYLYEHVMWEPAYPEHGFSIWMQRLDATDRGIHIIEAPEVGSASKNTLKLPNLKPISLSNGTWMVLQKQDQPWQGLWIYAAVLDGVHIEVDGANRTIVESVAASL